MQIVESVMRGHPDKACDQIADAIVDEYLRRDPKTEVALEVMGSHGAVMVGGRVASSADFDVAAIVRRVYRDVGYLDDIEPFVNLETGQSESGGAGDATSMAIVHGYATHVTPEMLPRPVVFAQSIARRIDDLRLLDPEFSWLRPDGKVHVGMEGDKVRLLVLCVQHEALVEATFIRTRLVERVLTPLLGSLDGVKVLINRHGAFTRGGFQEQSGVSGRKIAVDTYGGLLPSSASALSGKGPSEPQRLGTYMCRYVAKNLVAAGVGKSIFLQAVYVRGEERPIFLQARTGEGRDVSALLTPYDFRPRAVLERLELAKPLYERTACYGHFGREEFPWEKIEKFK